MSDTKPESHSHDGGSAHAGHTYHLLLCDQMAWTGAADPAMVPLFKAALRDKLRDLLAPAGGDWSHDLEEIARKYRLCSLHEIPERVHRELIQEWLDRINRTRDKKEQLFMGNLSVECCYRPPHLWYACAKSQLRIGADEASAKPWLVEVTVGKTLQRIPVTIGAGWNCEITHDGRPQKQAKPGSARASA